MLICNNIRMLYTRSVDKTVGAVASAGDVALPNCDAGDNRRHR